jgi:hypothetical protein
MNSSTLSRRESQAYINIYPAVRAEDSRRHSLPNFIADRQPSPERTAHTLGMEVAGSETRPWLISSSYKVSYGKTSGLKRLAGKISTFLQIKRTNSLPSTACKPWTAMSSRNHGKSNPDSSSMPSGVPESLNSFKEDRKSVKFGGGSTAASNNVEWVGSFRSSIKSASISSRAMVDGFAFDAATHDLLKAMQTCMRNSLTDEGICNTL